MGTYPGRDVGPPGGLSTLQASLFNITHICLIAQSKERGCARSCDRMTIEVHTYANYKPTVASSSFLSILIPQIFAFSNIMPLHPAILRHNLIHIPARQALEHRHHPPVPLLLLREMSEGESKVEAGDVMSSLHFATFLRLSPASWPRPPPASPARPPSASP